MQQTHEFELEDYAGQKHKYVCALHPPTSGGLSIALDLAALGVVPLAGLAQGLLKDLEAIGLGSTNLLDIKLDKEGLAKILGKLDLSSAALSVKSALLSDQAGTLPQRMLKHTVRDGKMLEKDSAFDEAFTGNYMELAGVLWEVARANRFLPLGST